MSTYHNVYVCVTCVIYIQHLCIHFVHTSVAFVLRPSQLFQCSMKKECSILKAQKWT